MPPEERISARGDVLGIERFLAPGRAVLRLRGELDLAGRRRLLAAIADCGRRDVVVDLAQVTFLDCSGYMALEDAATVLGEHGHELCLVGARDGVGRVLGLLGQRCAAHIPDAAPVGLVRPRR